MRIEIHRWRMTIPVRQDGRVAVSYDVRVPINDCPPNNSNLYISTEDGEYKNYPDATWSTSLSPGVARYMAWLAHEREAERRMLNFLHEHCPETRELNEWPTFWAYVDPNLAGDLHTVHFILPTPKAATARSRQSAIAAPRRAETQLNLMETDVAP